MYFKSQEMHGELFAALIDLLASNITQRAMSRDETQYPEAEAFRPERFLTSDGKPNQEIPDPIQVFGFGRRKCPGRHFAEDMLFLTMASILAVFNIEKPTDDYGNTIEVTEEFTSGLFR